jgi:hypothetical protein
MECFNEHLLWQSGVSDDLPGYSYLFGQVHIAAPVEGGTEEVEAYLCLLPY